MTEAHVAWADTPFTMIPTPGRGEDWAKQHESVFIAREMTFAHNGILRGLNSIYQQCTHVTEPSDIKDLLQYTRMWYDWIEEHHEAEERMFFPDIEEITGVKGLMEKNIAQHHAFLPGLEELGKYSKQTKIEEYDGLKLVDIIDRFGTSFTSHLEEEIQTLLALKVFDGPVLKKAYLKFDIELRKGDPSTLYPMVFGTADFDFENEVWPVVPGFVRYIVHYWYERTHWGAWRFSPSTTWGKRRPLMFLQKKE